MGNILYVGIYNQLVDIFMFFFDFEGFFIVILEVMVYGKLIVVLKVGGINEIVIDGKNGYVVNNIFDIFVDKIKYILDDLDRCYDFGIYLWKFFNENLIVNKMVNKYVDIYML